MTLEIPVQMVLHDKTSLKRVFVASLEKTRTFAEQRRPKRPSSELDHILLPLNSWRQEFSEIDEAVGRLHLTNIHQCNVVAACLLAGRLGASWK